MADRVLGRTRLVRPTSCRWAASSRTTGQYSDDYYRDEDNTEKREQLPVPSEEDLQLLLGPKIEIRISSPRRRHHLMGGACIPGLALP